MHKYLTHTCTCVRTYTHTRAPTGLKWPTILFMQHVKMCPQCVIALFWQTTMDSIRHIHTKKMEDVSPKKKRTRPFWYLLLDSRSNCWPISSLFYTEKTCTKYYTWRHVCVFEKLSSVLRLCGVDKMLYRPRLDITREFSPFSFLYRMPYNPTVFLTWKSIWTLLEFNGHLYS